LCGIEFGHQVRPLDGGEALNRGGRGLSLRIVRGGGCYASESDDRQQEKHRMAH
jgi:hypothetical protein